MKKDFEILELEVFLVIAMFGTLINETHLAVLFGVFFIAIVIAFEAAKFYSFSEDSEKEEEKD